MTRREAFQKKYQNNPEWRAARLAKFKAWYDKKRAEDPESFRRAGRRRYIKDADKRKAAVAAYYLKRKTERPQELSDSIFRTRLKTLYGITVEQYRQIEAWQGGGCLFCGKKPTGSKRFRRLFVEHCHDTGEIRGLTCSRCNTALAAFGDKPEALITAAARAAEFSRWWQSTRLERSA